MSDKNKLTSSFDIDSREAIKTVGKLTSNSSSFKKTIDKDYFFEIVNLDPKSCSKNLMQDIDQADLSYRFLTNDETEKLCNDIKIIIETGKLSKSGPKKHKIWEKGWGENLASYIASQDLASLKPRFVRDGLVKRLKGRYIVPRNPEFESIFFSLIRRAIFENYFISCESIYEFGAGTGHNLIAFRQYDSLKKLIGTDWSEKAVKLMHELNKIDKMNIGSFVFDMFMPDLSLELDKSSGILTVGALEQLGSNFWPFLFFMLRQKNVKYFVHFETFNEFYNLDTVQDRLAVAYCRNRNYINGFVSALDLLEYHGIIEIIQKTRTFGSQFHEGYSFVVWRLRKTDL